MIQAAACLSTLFWCSGAGPTWRTRASSRAPPREPPTRPTRASRRRRSRLGRSRWASSSAPSWRRQLAAAARAPSSSLAAGCSCALSSASWAPSSSGAGSRNSRPACRGALKRSMERAPKKVRGPAGAAPGAAAAACGGRGSGNGGAERRLDDVLQLRCFLCHLIRRDAAGASSTSCLLPSFLRPTHRAGHVGQRGQQAQPPVVEHYVLQVGHQQLRLALPGLGAPQAREVHRVRARVVAAPAPLRGSQVGQELPACMVQGVVGTRRGGGNTKLRGGFVGDSCRGRNAKMQTPAGGAAHRRKSPASRAAARGVAAPSAATPSLRRSSRQ